MILKKYNEFNNLNENFEIHKLENIADKIIKDLKIKFDFISKYKTTISIYYPIFENVIKNTTLNKKITKTDIITLTICSLAIVFKENNSQIFKIKHIIEEKNHKKLLDNFIDFILNINNIFKNIFSNMNKPIETDIDVFKYDSLYKAFLLSLYEMIELYNINLLFFSKDFFSKGVKISTSLGELTITLKHFINMINKKMIRLTKKN